MFQEAVVIDANTYNTEERSNESGRILGTLGGRHIVLSDQVVHLPDTPSGCALAVLLTGQSVERSRQGTLPVDCHHVGDLSELLVLLTNIGLAIQEDANPTDVGVSPVLQELLDFGIESTIAAQLAGDPWVTTERVLTWLDYLKRCARSFTNPKGMLVTRLRTHVEAPCDPQTRTRYAAQSANEPKPPAEGNNNPQPPNPLAYLDEPLPSGRSPAAIWQTTYGELRGQMLRETFDAWLRNTQLVGYEEGTYTIDAHNTYALEWLEKRLKKVIVRTLCQVAGQPVRVCFVIQGNTPAAE